MEKLQNLFSLTPTGAKHLFRACLVSFFWLLCSNAANVLLYVLLAGSFDWAAGLAMDLLAGRFSDCFGPL